MNARVRREDTVTNLDSIAERQPASGSRASRTTIKLIIESAQDVLIEKGYAGFTTRAVAETAKISQGNLGYHFKTKQDLLRAVVADQIETILDRLATLLQGIDSESANGMNQLLSDLWKETTSDRVVRLFRELWAIALRDSDVRDGIDDMYDVLMEKVVAMLQQFYPNAEVQSLRECVQLLAIVSEGTSVLFGTRSKRAVSQERMIQIVSQVLDSVARRKPC
jgi:AcrR family transcriptional regulator